jgi:flagellar hook-associated protein 1 FlgK
MAGLFGNLSNSVKALNAQSYGIEAAGRNLANVNTAGYSRQRVSLGDRGTYMGQLGPESLGVEALGVTQLRDTLLDSQVSREVSLTSYYSTHQSGLQMAQADLGQSISSASSDGSVTGGIAEALTNFFNSFESYAAKPTDAGERQTLVTRAQILAENLQQVDTRLTQTQSDMGTRIAQDVSTANTLLKSISELNLQINSLEQTNPGSAVDLRDARQLKLEQLAKLTNFETRPQPGYPSEIQVYTKDSSGNEVDLVNQNTAATLTYDTTSNSVTTTQIAGPSTGSTATLAFTGGSIKGAFDVKDTDLATARTNLDALAKQLVTSVNGVYSAAGSSLSFFNPAGLSAATISVTNFASTDRLAGVSSSGDNSIAIAVGALSTKAFSTSGTPPDSIDGSFSQYYNSIVTGVGQSLDGTNSRLNNQQTIEKMVRSQRDAVSGVSLDEELADLMKYQRAFQAASRVVNTIDSLLDTIVNQMGR